MNEATKTVFRIMVTIISLSLCLSAAGTILDLWRRKSIVDVRQNDLFTITRENQQLKQKYAETQQTDYVERVARDKLGMVKEGEIIVLLPESRSLGIQQGGVALPNWKMWWKLFF